jgi:Malectin domain
MAHTKVAAIFCLLFFTFFVSSPVSIFACDTDAVSVLDYGAIPNDGIGDSDAVQSIFDNANVSKICFPAGEYLFDQSTSLSRSNVTVQGEWEKTVLKMSAANTESQIGIPEKNGILPTSPLPENIVFERMVLDGARSSAGKFGIWLQQGVNITFRDMKFTDYNSEGLIVGNGHDVNKFVIIERVMVENAGRNGIHIGACKDCVIRNTFIKDAQNTSIWGNGRAGNAIDVEVEGGNADAFVSNLLIENTLMDKTLLDTACYGINLQPAYGSISNTTIKNTIGIHSNLASNLKEIVEQNHYVSGVNITNNWLSNYAPAISSNAVRVWDTTNVTFTGNRLAIDGNTSAIWFEGVSGINTPTTTDADNQIYRPDGNAAFFSYLNSAGSTRNSDIYLPGTKDTGSPSSRFYFTPPSGFYQQMPGNNINIGVTQLSENVAAFQPPEITRFEVSPSNASIHATDRNDPQGKRMRAMLIQNGFPIALKDVNSDGSCSFPLTRQAVANQQFEVRVYNEVGKKAISNTFTFHPETQAAIKINAGGSAAGTFAADNSYIGGSAFDYKSYYGVNFIPIDTTGAINPGPPELYETVRYGDNFSYTLNGLTPSTAYTVRLHLVENYKDALAGMRKGNYTVNGFQALVDFDVFAAAGGHSKLVIREVPTMADAQGRIVVEVTRGASSTQPPSLSAVEVTSSESTSAIFVRLDSTTGGNWVNAYGGQGYSIAREVAKGGDITNLPVWAQFSLTGQYRYNWADTSTEVRALFKSVGDTDRIAACWYGEPQFEMTFNLTDGQTHQLALYNLDWDRNNYRQQRIEIVDAATGNILDTRPVSNFSNGVYAVWNVKGQFKVRVIDTVSGSNAVVSAIFLDSPQP